MNHFSVKADDKLTFKVWPSRSTMVDNNVFEIVATIKLNDASSVEATLKFYKIGRYLLDLGEGHCWC